MIVLSAAVFAAMANTASAQNPGDPLYCGPNEGVSFLIVNGGAGVFTADSDCYTGSSATSVPPPLSITTGQGGTLTRTTSNRNYTYTPPAPTFTGLDTFSIAVTTSWNVVGGPGSASGTHTSNGTKGPDTVNITLNVLSATTILQVAGAAKLVPIPAGSITGCGAQGNSSQGPPASAVGGCTTAVGLGPNRSPSTATTSHGSVSNSGTTVRYTPTAGYTGADTFTYQVFGVNTDGVNSLNSGNATMQVTVNAPLVITHTSPLPSVMTGTPYPAQTFAATGGFPDYTFSLASGALPPGLSLSGGVLSGTPDTPGIYNFNIKVTDCATDGVPNTLTKAFQIAIAGPLSITTASPLTAGTVGAAYTQAFAASGGISPYTFSLASGSLPPGLTVSLGTLSGSPTTSGPYDFIIQAADSLANTATKAFTLAVSALAPTVTSVSPSSGPTAGGNSVTIAGTTFTGATSVTFGGTAATSLAVVNATTITATVPAGAAGSASVIVITPAGSNAANTLYTYIPGPTVTSVNPSSGSTAGGTVVTITGTTFTGATSVTFGGVAASFTVVNATTITATVPVGAAGDASVIVTTPAGSNPANTLYLYADGVVSSPTLGEWGMIGLTGLLMWYGWSSLRRHRTIGTV
jgi:hypothetical protein